ncbi:hypothetical protein GLAREA_04783 [Glarea lozoyensis ATCC 20868]|uniref:Uncharacterized protein n=1 Tax=Glarea lozoyensis (strain ATCC 20868 / MF5171) TaxID=1116229 RepID=S3CNC8_GLAL2|nr:uncharacterized protein GLAREA_04783 [Glarea lozoyensis ATCC 20868]EPE27992.1 hypothetical protein GLAREA_04783 [Glarea lozoyensis ATCC 20868]
MSGVSDISQSSSPEISESSEGTSIPDSTPLTTPSKSPKTNPQTRCKEPKLTRPAAPTTNPQQNTESQPDARTFDRESYYPIYNAQACLQCQLLGLRCSFTTAPTPPTSSSTPSSSTSSDPYIAAYNRHKCNRCFATGEGFCIFSESKDQHGHPKWVSPHMTRGMVSQRVDELLAEKEGPRAWALPGWGFGDVVLRATFGEPVFPERETSEALVVDEEGEVVYERSYPGGAQVKRVRECVSRGAGLATGRWDFDEGRYVEFSESY